MPTSAPSPHPRFTAYVERARQQDLRSRTVLSDAERNAVLVAAVTALPLESDERVSEFEALIDDGCPTDLAEDIIIQMAAYMGYPKVSQALHGFDQACANRGRAKTPAQASPYKCANWRRFRPYRSWGRPPHSCAFTSTRRFMWA